MPKRWCIEPGCRALFHMDSTGTQRCPACQLKHDTARQQRGNTSNRGYGTDHQRTRTELLATWQPGQACAICGQPTYTRNLDLAHNEDRSGYLGLAHAACNRATNKGTMST